MTDRILALDTSLVVPLVVQPHPRHGIARRWQADHAGPLWMCGHAAVEAYAVLTRLPGDLLLPPDEAADLVRRRFVGTVTLAEGTAAEVPALLGAAGIAGGAAFDALVALAARDGGALLVIADRRARSTYERIDVPVEFVSCPGPRRGTGGPPRPSRRRG